MLGARPCPPPERLLADGETVSIAGLELEVLHTPGHTPGGVCFLHAPTRTALVGDTIFAGSVGRTDLPGGDWRALVRSIRERLFRLEGDWRLLPGHGPETSLERERRDNPFVGAGAGEPPAY
jgi:glyoxylase-like metal-dependent hydrolase (beta-lactamase superfamily II)